MRRGPHPVAAAEEPLAGGFSLLAISPAHARAYGQLPYVQLAGKPQRDPFDRLLVAQASVEAIPPRQSRSGHRRPRRRGYLVM